MSHNGMVSINSLVLTFFVIGAKIFYFAVPVTGSVEGIIVYISWHPYKWHKIRKVHVYARPYQKQDSNTNLLRRNLKKLLHSYNTPNIQH